MKKIILLAILAIVFQTRWLYNISKDLLAYATSMSSKKIFIEVYISEPTWYYSSQHGTHHDVYIYSSIAGVIETFYKLTEKPYWDYENGFDT